MNKEKIFDCVKFKYELQEKLLKKSGAKNLREYANYANTLAQKLSLHRIGEGQVPPDLKARSRKTQMGYQNP
jgi:hypothetical protein